MTEESPWRWEMAMHVERLEARRVNRGREQIFFCGMSLMLLGTMLLGFRQSYFPLGPRPDALKSGVIVLHGIVFTLFIVLLQVQVWLIAAKRLKWHMAIGLWIYGLAALMVPLGIVSAADEWKRDLATGPPYVMNVTPQTFSIVSVTGMVMFGTLIGWSYIVRRQPAAHKRLALYAVVSMMDAGTDRWPWAAWGVDPGWSLWVYTGMLLLPAVYDLLSLRRVHWATMFAAPFAWTLHRLELPLGGTRAWHWVAELMLKHLT